MILRNQLEKCFKWRKGWLFWRIQGITFHGLSILIDRILIHCFKNLFPKKFYGDVSVSESEVKKQWLVKAAAKYRNFISTLKKGGVRQGFIPEHVWERWTQLLKSDESIKKSETNEKIDVEAVKLLLGLTHVALSQSENTAKNLPFKRVEIQRQTSYTCMSIRMVMMGNILLANPLEWFMKNMKQYYGKKPLNLILINTKHTTKLPGEKEEKSIRSLI